MCTKHVYHPTGPCCGTMGLCKRFPSIDWNRTAWKLVHPGAKWAEVLYVQHSHGGPVINFGPGDADNGKYSYSGTMNGVADVLFSWHGYHMPAGVFRSSGVSACNWQIECRERLCPRTYLLAYADGTDDELTAEFIVSDPQLWDMYRGTSNSDASAITGPFDYEAEVLGASRFYNWRNILKSAECVVLPAMRNAGAVITPEESIEGGLLHRLELARTLIDTPATDLPWLTPTWMDRAVAFTLSGGITFGVEFDERSPYFNQLIISEGGQYDSETIGDVTTTWLTSTPWELVSGNSGIATFGQTLRFERTDDNDTLPAWLELELIRI